MMQVDSNRHGSHIAFKIQDIFFELAVPGLKGECWDTDAQEFILHLHLYYIRRYQKCQGLATKAANLTKEASGPVRQPGLTGSKALHNSVSQNGIVQRAQRPDTHRCAPRRHNIVTPTPTPEG